METIKNYLESMFANLPNTLEVKRAKEELYSMMEDKYSELIAEGKPENEAIGIVISEFGNLDELAESLGIHQVVNELAVSDRRVISIQEAEDYVNASFRHRFMIGLGVLLCIFSVMGPVLFSPISEVLGMPGSIGIGVGLMFVLIAAGVGILIFSSFQMNDWKFIDKELCSIDYNTAEILAREKNDDQTLHGMLLTIGIIFCIVSVIPVIVLNTVLSSKFTILTEGIGPAFIFAGAGLGVLLIIVSGAREEAYRKLLSLNDIETVAGNYEPVKRERKQYSGNLTKHLMANYWSTVLCIYLILSFLSFNWGSTWLIFPIAGILRKPIESFFQEKE